MRIPRVTAESVLDYLSRHRWLIAEVLAVVGCAVALGWFIGLGTLPSRRAGDPVSLDRYGIPGVEVRIVYPTHLSVEPNGDKVATITALAQALSQDAVQPVMFIFPLSDDAITFVDAQGSHIPGRLEVVPGYPDAIPYDLRVVHGDTQFQAHLLRPWRVSLVPRIKTASGIVAVPDLAFQIRLESQGARAFRRFSASISSAGMPYLFLGLILLLVAWGWYRVNKRQRQDVERELASSYVRLREQIKLDRWADARKEIEGIRLLGPHYRDLDQLDMVVSAAETAGWRREQLYRAGLGAYRERDWPSAVQAFSAVEQETPYYRDVRFLRRTAALYADLQSRDRSLRITAARELGEVADLVDMMPLLDALGDRSSEVAATAEASFERLGLGGVSARNGAFDALLEGIRHDSPAVRQRAYHLIEKYGQSAHDQLLTALHSADPRIVEPVAMLLVTLGAREELADALLWADTEHHEAIVKAMLTEGIAACNPLIRVLLAAPTERQQVIINALATLESDTRIAHRLQEVLRQSKTPAEKALLRRALEASTASSRGDRETSALESQQAGRHREESTGQGTLKPRRPKLFDKRRP